MHTDHHIKQHNPLASFLVSGGISIALFGILSSTLFFWDRSGWELAPSSRYTFAIGLLLVLFVMARYGFKNLTAHLDVSGFCLGLLLLFISDWLCRPYSLFAGPAIRGEIIVCSIVCYFVIRTPIFFNALAFLSPLILMVCFAVESGGRLLTSDDHLSFIYRLSLLKENFPSIPFYSPLWNAGVDARDFFATGALNVFAIFSPLIYLLDVSATYNLIVSLIVFALVPICAYVAARVEEIPHPGPAIASTLALGSSLVWYKWALKYGTLGFLVSAALVALNLSLVSHILRRREHVSRCILFLAVISITLMLLWSASGLIFVPVIAIAAAHGVKLLTWPRFQIMVGSLLIINLTWISMFWSVSQVDKFLTTPRPSYESMHTLPVDNNAVEAPKAARGHISLGAALKVLRRTSVNVNPLILFLIIPGIYLFQGLQRWIWGASTIWCIILGSVLASYKPQLELDRMLVVAALFGSVPVAQALQALFSQYKTLPTYARIVSLLAGGFLVVTPFATGSVIRNRSLEQYYFANNSIAALRHAITQFGGNGRVLFSGFSLHELSHGHLAPLSVWTQRPLMASSFLHNLWRYKQIVPKSFLERGADGIHEYFDLHNVSSVLAHEAEWKDFFTHHPQEYEKVWHSPKFSMFKRINSTSTYFLKGSGEVRQQSSNAVTLRMDSNEAVIKFNYFPFLTSSGCQLSEEKVAPEISFIRLSNCVPGEQIVIRSVSPLKRVLGQRKS